MGKQGDDALLFEETDEAFYVGIGKSRSEEVIFIECGGLALQASGCTVSLVVCAVTSCSALSFWPGIASLYVDPIT